jgi:hypothetical protein
MTIPLHTALSLTICVAACALAGLFASGLAGTRMRRMHAYAAGADDWAWHVVLPGVAYALLLVAGLLLHSTQGLALVGVAAVVMALLAIGIHNAWDVAVYLVVMAIPEPESASAPAAPPPAPADQPAPPGPA